MPHANHKFLHHTVLSPMQFETILDDLSKILLVEIVIGTMLITLWTSITETGVIQRIALRLLLEVGLKCGGNLQNAILFALGVIE